MKPKMNMIIYKINNFKNNNYCIIGHCYNVNSNTIIKDD